MKRHPAIKVHPAGPFYRDPFDPFFWDKRRPPYLADWLPQPVLVVPLAAKVRLAAPRAGSQVHHIRNGAVVLEGERLRYGARWLCNGRSKDLVLVANADAHSGQVCARCASVAMGHVVYRCFGDNGTLLYVGSTGGYAARMAQHAGSSDWWSQVACITHEKHQTLSVARAAERLAIKTEQPQHNSQRFAPETKVPA